MPEVSHRSNSLALSHYPTVTIHTSIGRVWWTHNVHVRSLHSDHNVAFGNGARFEWHCLLIDKELRSRGGVQFGLIFSPRFLHECDEFGAPFVFSRFHAIRAMADTLAAGSCLP